MLAVSHPTPSPLPSTSHRGAMDDSRTINPAALNAPAASTIAPNLLTQPTQRNLKRSRSPDASGDNIDQREGGAGEDTKSSKRSRTQYAGDASSSAQARQMSVATMAHTAQTPHTKTQSLPHPSPTQASPQRSTPSSSSKPAVVKALPTVRDHTTDQLGKDGDEYLYRETDPDGENKVSRDGYPLDNRKFRCRTFQVPGRGQKLFMLATECARVLGYRDSYLLFNKNRSLFKIIASQAEKDNLIQQEILPYSYRSRQIAIVTARSMFRQFGARIVEGGRRVRDDYWEAKARKQGFTEEDPAGEKRPGAAKQREAAAAESSQPAVLTSMPQAEIIYNANGLEAQPPGLHQANLAPLPMIHMAGDELRPGAFGNIIRPRQDISGPAYQDRTQVSGAGEILTQATQAAEWNKQLGAQRQHRTAYLNDYWKREHEQPTTQTTQAEADVGTIAPQNLQSPQAIAGAGASRLQQQDPLSHGGHQMMPQAYAPYPNHQNVMASPIQALHRQPPQNQMHQESPSSMGMGGAPARPPSYGGYPGNPMWQPGQPQPQPSPLSQPQPMPHYGQHQQQQHQSPMPPPQMSGQGGMGYGQMNQMGNPAFGGMNRSIYQPSPSPQQFNMQSSAGQQPGMQGWAAPGSMPQYGQGYQ